MTDELKIPGFTGIFRTDAEACAVYSEAAGIARAIPAGVAVPASVTDVQAVIRWARAMQAPVIPRGSGTGMAGGAVGHGVVLDLSRFREIGIVDVARKRVRVGAGALRGDVERAARAVGLRFPPDPSSGAYCTIGGMISTNAAGAHTLKYGQTRVWVASVECVLSDGSSVTIARGTPPPDVPLVRRLMGLAGALRAKDAASPVVHAGVCKESSGYNIHAYARSGELVDLLVGSEGTLAVITGAELMLTQAPGATSAVLGAFATLEQAVDAAVRTRAAGAAACELLDRTYLEVAAGDKALPDIPPGTEAVLLAEAEGSDATEAAHGAAELARLFAKAGALQSTVAFTPLDQDSLWALRHAASPRLATLGPSLQSMQIIEDSAVPPAALPTYVRGIRALFHRYQLPGVIFGHAGDAHVHVNPLIDTGRDGWHDTVRHLLDDVTVLTARLGGTLAGEHGDGRLRTPLLDRVWPAEALALFRSVKEAFDPAGILNPGVKVPLAGQHAITEIKYDPALPSLPPRAAAALALVAHERAYARFRLDLLMDGADSAA